jgi:hypothetical protein
MFEFTKLGIVVLGGAAYLLTVGHRLIPERIPPEDDVLDEYAMDANAFVLAVTFAASAAFPGPLGYQTNLLVCGPGGYRFLDHARVGTRLQLLLSVVATAGIAVFWGL